MNSLFFTAEPVEMGEFQNKYSPTHSENMDKYSYLSNAHPDYIESLYKAYQENPDSVDIGWRKFFEGFEFGQTQPAPDSSDEVRRKEINVLNLINAYRTRGHLFTKTNPVRERRKYTPTLDLESFGLSEDDLDTVFEAGNDVGLGPAKLRDIVELLQQTYCRSIGAEYMFIRVPERNQWLRERMESTRNTPNFTLEEKRHILDKLNQAVVFENFLHTKYIGQKRFALSGNETIIPALDAIIEKGAGQGVDEFVIGMAHRGRLNILANILRKSYQDIFAEFDVGIVLVKFPPFRSVVEFCPRNQGESNAGAFAQDTPIF